MDYDNLLDMAESFVEELNRAYHKLESVASELKKHKPQEYKELEDRLTDALANLEAMIDYFIRMSNYQGGWYEE